MDGMIVAVLLKAGWGDGSTCLVHGKVTEQELKDMMTIASELYELVEVIDSHDIVDPNSRNRVIDDVKYWVLSGDEEKIEATKHLTAAEFAQYARKHAPPGYGGDDDESEDEDDD